MLYMYQSNMPASVAQLDAPSDWRPGPGFNLGDRGLGGGGGGGGGNHLRHQGRPVKVKHTLVGEIAEMTFTKCLLQYLTQTFYGKKNNIHIFG